jgi:Recombination endonuclease VII
MKKICKMCGCDFTQRVHNQAICSEKCLKKYRNDWMKADHKKKVKIRGPIHYVCKVCEKPYSVMKNGGRPMTCSLECQDKFHRARVKNWILKDKYGISLAEYNQKLIEQNGQCAICERSHSEFQHGLYVDRDHETGKVRDLLCREFNFGLGAFKEKNEFFLKAVDYLKSHREVVNPLRIV